MNAIIKASRRQALCAIVTTAVLAIAPAAWGTHKTDHRYTVWGEIKYEDGTPAAEIPVKLLIANGEPLGEVKTDYRGRYRVVLHVHNEDLYKIFDMQVNNVTRKVRLLFNPNDIQTERGERIDMVVKRAADVETSGLTQ